MKPVKLITKPTCPFCIHAKEVFDSLGVQYEDINALEHPDVRQEYADKYSWPTVPMIFIGDEFIGGASDLDKLHASGDLQKKLEA